MDNPEVDPNIPPVTPSGVEMNPDARNWGLFCHLAAFIGFVVVFPGATIIAPLVIWQMKKAEFPFVDACGKEALNFQITLLIAFVISIPFCFILIGFAMIAFLGVYGIVMPILAAIKAANGEFYRYPYTWRLVN